MTGRTIVCILGMHRSGTSVLARVLNLLGAYLGPPEQMMPAAPENPKGFWEHLAITQVNDAILARLGGTVLDPPGFAEGWVNDPKIADLRQTAGALVARDFADAVMWGWKDPRTCLTLPFWQELLPSMRYVLSLRQPWSVARSLQRRDGLTLAKALHLWLLHLRQALAHTEGQPRIVVAYEDLLTDWRKEVRRLARFIGRPGEGERAEVQAAIGEFLDPALQHNQEVSIAGLEGAERVIAAAIRLAQRVYDGLRGGWERPDAVCTMLAEALAILGPEIQQEAERQQERTRQEWCEAVEKLRRRLMELAPRGTAFILADESQTQVECPDRDVVPFLERNGEYWGRPGDDAMAVRELERLRQGGASLIAFAWPAFWWLDYYAGLRQHLWRNFRCVRRDEFVVAFELQSGER
jgi:hypothetical protein